jgi:hypothetical protein
METSFGDEFLVYLTGVSQNILLSQAAILQFVTPDMNRAKYPEQFEFRAGAVETSCEDTSFRRVSSAWRVASAKTLGL